MCFLVSESVFSCDVNICPTRTKGQLNVVNISYWRAARTEFLFSREWACKQIDTCNVKSIKLKLKKKKKSGRKKNFSWVCFSVENRIFLNKRWVDVGLSNMNSVLSWHRTTAEGCVRWSDGNGILLIEMWLIDSCCTSFCLVIGTA